MFTIKHYFREGLITLSIEYFKINQDDALLYNHSHVSHALAPLHCTALH
jgi:hypothetical protein